MRHLITSFSGTTSLPGMALAAAAFALVTVVDTIFKLVAGGGHPAYQILLVNAGFALLPIFGWAAVTGGLRQFKTGRVGLHLLRGAISVVSAFAAIYAYSRLPLTDFYAIMFAGPLLVTALSSVWLGEKVRRDRWAAIVVGFIGILIVVDPLTPSGNIESVAEIEGRGAAFLAVTCYALSVVLIRRMRLGESNLSFAFYGYMTMIVIGGAAFGFSGGPDLSLGDVARLALSGTVAGISSICLLTAYHRTPVSLIAPFQYTQIIWGAVAGYLFWAHVPELRLLAGAAVVALSGLYVVRQEVGLARLFHRHHGVQPAEGE